MADQLNNQQAQPLYQQPAYPQAAYPAPATTSVLGVNLQDTQFWKGALIGAAVALLVTNESVQKSVVKTVSRLTAAAQSGVEEMKEKFEDAKAEVIAESKSE
ncbi:MAG: hypothetical protein CSA20_02130 [Deltaproteobacteria bacterium]|nr:MAG: hypothetical protein CSA20_02130 [Deltaproteobacteria bacterium]